MSMMRTRRYLTISVVLLGAGFLRETRETRDSGAVEKAPLSPIWLLATDNWQLSTHRNSNRSVFVVCHPVCHSERSEESAPDMIERRGRSPRFLPHPLPPPVVE
jgi:hypothetical protein